MGDGSRWQESKAVAAQLGDDLETMKQAMTARDDEAPASIEAILEPLGEGELVGWAAVYVCRNADGSTTTSIVEDGHSSPLEIKGYLHSAVWEAAHHP